MLQPVGAGVSAILALGVLVIALRRDQFSSIASFGAGAGVAALVSVAVGGGTTFAYTTGAEERQHAVRVVRNVVVIPSLVAATSIATVLYDAIGDLNPIGVAAGGLATAASVGAELDSCYLRRNLRTGQLFAADLLNRAVAFTAIALATSFALAMLAGAVARASLLWILTRSDPSRTGRRRISKKALALAYEVKLTGLSIMYSICDRVGALTAPAVAPLPVAAGFVAMLSAQQNISGVLVTGLQTTLAARSQQRMQLLWANRLDAVLVLAGVVTAAGMIAFEEQLGDALGLGGQSDAADYWVAIAILIPASLASRLFEFRFLTTGQTRNALVARTAAVTVAVGAAIAALVNAELSLLAFGLLAAEAASVISSLVLRAAHHPRRRGKRLC